MDGATSSKWRHSLHPWPIAEHWPVMSSKYVIDATDVSLITRAGQARHPRIFTVLCMSY